MVDSHVDVAMLLDSKIKGRDRTLQKLEKALVFFLFLFMYMNDQLNLRTILCLQ